MQIDIVKVAEILGAAGIILSVIIGGYKLYDKLVDDINELKKRIAELEDENKSSKKEDTIVIYALRACLDGLKQQGCNGKVTEAIELLDKHINKAAHDQED